VQTWTDSRSIFLSWWGCRRGCGSLVKIHGLMRTQNFGICTSLDIYTVSCHLLFNSTQPLTLSGMQN